MIQALESVHPGCSRPLSETCLGSNMLAWSPRHLSGSFLSTHSRILNLCLQAFGFKI